MDSSQLLFLIFVVITPLEYSETAEAQCVNFDLESFNLLEGEAFYFVPYALPNSNLSNEEVTWYKNNSQIEYISTEKNKTVHYDGGALYFLNLSTENSGFYTARHKKPSGECFNYHLKITVFKEKKDKALLYGGVKNSDLNKKLICPVKYTCRKMKGTLTWMKDFKLLQGHHEDKLWVYNATKKDEGIYTCICTWTYNDMVYNSSGSRSLKCEERRIRTRPAEGTRNREAAVGIAGVALQSLQTIIQENP